LVKGRRKEKQKTGTSQGLWGNDGRWKDTEMDEELSNWVSENIMAPDWIRTRDVVVEQPICTFLGENFHQKLSFRMDWRRKKQKIQPWVSSSRREERWQRRKELGLRQPTRHSHTR
jgi:hypothetical protein